MTHPLRHTPSQQPRRAFVLLSLLLLLLCCNTMSAKERRPAVAVERLRVENMREPLGLDTAEPRFSWIITSAQNDVVQTAYHLIVSDDRGEVWNTGRVESRQQLWVPYRGLPLRSGQHLSWRLKVYTNRGETDWSAPQRFSIGLLTESRWGGRWIGLERLMPGEAAGVQHSRMAARYLRKVFTLRGKPVHRATAYVAGLGLYRLFVNQQEVGADEVLKPAPSDYRKTIYYQTYDVTSLMADTFAVGIVVGNGKYFAPRQNKPYKNTTFGLPKCRLNIIVEYADGSTQRLVTDETWRVTASGPIRANNEYDGEVYDARQELDGWLTTGYDDAHWLQAERTALPQGTLRGKVMNSLTPKSLTPKSLTPGPSPMGEGSIYTQAQNHGQTQGTGLYTPLSPRRGVGGEAFGGEAFYDFHQNMAGWVSFMPAGRKGDTIRVRYAERLSADGSLYTDNLRDARSEDVYICNGHETQPWQPSFVYHGFRYAEVSGPATDVQAWFVADDMEHVGTFMCSDTILNRVVEAARWGIASNYKGVPVDCPQRNERQPWLGDRTVGALGESYLFDNERLYSKWTRDICEAQREDGTIPDVAPAFWNYYTDDVTWPAALPFICQMLYEQYGNDEPLRRCYPAMKRWALHMMQENMRDDLITKDKYGDWCMPPEKPELIHSQDPARQTDGTLIATAYMIRCLQLLRTFARHQQLSDDALYWQKRAEIMSDAFNRRFLHAAPGTSPRPGHTLYPDSTYYGNNTATANLLPLAFGIVPDTLRSEVAKQVVVNILEQNKGHVPCGVIGTSWLLRTLSDCGYGDVAYLIATQKTYPSWGYMVERGATTIWELWNGDTADPAMNSGNHVMLLGDLLTWCFQYLGGAPPSAPEGATIVSALHSALGTIEAPSGAVGGAFPSGAVGGAFPWGAISWAVVEHDTPYGLLSSRWRKTLQQLHWQVTVPCNTTATLLLPSGERRTVGSGTHIIDVPIPAHDARIIKDEFLYDGTPTADTSRDSTVHLLSPHASTIVETRRGDLVCAYFGGTYERNPDCCIWVSVKRKEERGWSAPVIAADGMVDGEKTACWNPVLTEMPSGELWLFYKVGKRVADWTGWLTKSKDGGRTWSKGEPLPQGFLGPIKNKPLLLPGADGRPEHGRLLCGSSTENDGWRFHVEIYDLQTKQWTKTQPHPHQATPAEIAAESLSTTYIDETIYSPPFSERHEEELSIDCIQPSFLQLKDGRLQVLMRSRNGFLATSYSSDQGQTWTPVTLTAVPNNQSGTDAVTLSDGRHVLAYNNFQTLPGTKKGPRTPLSLAVSDDDGRTWRHVLTLEDSPIAQYSYPAIIEGRDGTLHITYTWRRKRVAYKQVRL